MKMASPEKAGLVCKIISNEIMLFHNTGAGRTSITLGLCTTSLSSAAGSMPGLGKGDEIVGRLEY